MQLPKELRYSQLQAKAFFSYFKQWPIQPISNGGQYFPGQIIRVFFNALTQGVMDPYRSHIEITVETNQQVLPVGLLQVDNSAQSFIQQLVVTSKNRQVERIIQYGILAAYLTDVGISEFYAQSRQAQGLGYSSIGSYEEITSKPVTSMAGNLSAVLNGDTTNTAHLYGSSSNSGIFPTIPPRSNATIIHGSQPVSIGQLSGIYRGHISSTNTAWVNPYKQVWWWNFVMKQQQTICNDNARKTGQQFYGYNQNVRGQYVMNIMQNDYVDTNQTYSRSQIHVDHSVFQSNFPAKFTNNTVYSIYPPQTLPVVQSIDEQSQTTLPGKTHYVPNLCSVFGYTNLYSPTFAKGVWQPFISPTVPQCQMINGIIIPQKIPISRKTFKIPLISAVMGLLIPASQFVLLPIRAFNDLYLQLTIDPYAMFTSGYNDVAQYDNVGMGLMQQRAFQVTRLVYNLHTYQFYAPQMDQYLKTSLSTGIAINTNYWQMGNQYQIQNSQSITNAWPVACNQQALNEILVLFYPMDYQTLSFCRKHFRISNNITKLQLRINMEYYPTQPLSGNGGNPIDVDGLGSNSIFIQQINLSNGYFFSNMSPMHRINAFNFAINERPYNIFNTHTMYDTAMIDNLNYAWNAQSVNYDTALGMPYVHENRYVGKAAYLFTFQPYAHSKNLLNGIDCRLAKQFDIIFAQSPEQPFPRAQTMFIYTRSSIIVEYSANGIVNINK